MRRTVTAVIVGLALLGGYGAADVLDVAPGIFTLEPEPAAYPVPSATPSPSARLPLPSPAPSGMPVTPAGASAPLPSASGLRTALAPALADADLKGAAVVIRDALTGAHLVDIAADDPRVPASTVKIITALAVQASFPPASTLTTRVVQGDTPDSVVIVAGGDMFLAPDKGDPAAVVGRAGLGELADAVVGSLRARGVSAVTVRVDDSYAPGAQEATGWPASFRATGVVGPVAMLGLATQWAQDGRRGPADPVAEVAATFAARLSERGVVAKVGAPPTKVRGSASGSASGPGPAELGAIHSAPVADLMGLALELSDNTLSESLARQAAFRAGRPSDFEGTAAYLQEVLASRGIDTRGVSLHDASGLSRTNVLPARVLADVLDLAAVGTQPAFSAIIRALPVAGLTGTLQERFRDAPDAAAAGLVRAKTGTLTGVNALAGTVVTAEGRLLVFAVLQQGSVGTTDARAALDRFGATLAACGCR